ncbi:MAG: pantoate--beta-alanine ligase [Candidatus Omnitrophica bacterium 4484_171]|nr:MAG: pantoate--beta-alanine ligase [Candidatus Omnitrophica bacterium 4484_171]
MIVSRSINTIRTAAGKARKKSKRIGFVPTMGALHKGHLSLVKAARKECGFVTVSIFVNPIQFGPREDFRSYPRNFKKDEMLLEAEGVDLIFYPSISGMYDRDFSVYVEEISLSRYLCGKSRPGHFRGVCTVVAKLFNIVQPDIAYFGQKDYQQAQIIKRMVKDLNFSLKVKVMPIVREKDGLAMSSRNKYLSIKERKDALCLYNSLMLASKMVKGGICSSATVVANMKKLIRNQAPYARIDYINIVNPGTLEEVKKIKGKVLAALAVYIGKTRLIDNMLLR